MDMRLLVPYMNHKIFNILIFKEENNMTFAESLEQLRNSRCERGIITLYLNTLRTRNSEWKLRLKNGLKKLQEYIEVRGNQTELKDYLQVKNKIIKEMKEQQLKLQKSIVIIASADDRIWEVHHLQLEVENEFHWEKTPVISQLDRIQKKFPTSGIIVVQQKEILAIDMNLGEVSEESYFTLDVDKGNWVKYNDPSSSEGRSFISKKHLGDKLDVNLIRSLKDIAPIINQLAKNKKWKGIYMVGHPELVEEIMKHIKIGLIKVIPKNLLNQSTQQIIGEVLT